MATAKNQFVTRLLSFGGGDLQCFAAPPVSSPEVDDNQTKDDTPQVNDDAAQTCSGGSGTCTDEACSDEACATTTAVIENRESNPSPGDALLGAAVNNDALAIRLIIETMGVSSSHSNPANQSALHLASLWGNGKIGRAHV